MPAKSHILNNQVFVVIPAYNGGAVLGQTVDRLLSYGFTVVVVDDGSAIPAIRFLHDASVHCLRHASQLGQGAALQTGMADWLYEQLDDLRPLRQEARKELLAESRNHPACKLLSEVPWLGPIRVALVTPALDV
jgi:glycosyltransferase involved in cell wall biosynthesis